MKEYYLNIQSVKVKVTKNNFGHSVHFSFIQDENHDIAIAMSPSHADPVLP